MAIALSEVRQTAEQPGEWSMTGSSNDTGRVLWLTFFTAGHAEGGEGGVYPLTGFTTFHSADSEKCRLSAARPISTTTINLKIEEIYNV